MPVNIVQNIQATNQVVTPVSSQAHAPALSEANRKLSRFVISKVEETKAQPQQQQQQQQLIQNQPLQQQQQQQQVNQVTKSIVNSPENDQQMNIQQNQVQSPGQFQQVAQSQGNQAQMFFHQHHGGVVS